MLLIVIQKDLIGLSWGHAAIDILLIKYRECGYGTNIHHAIKRLNAPYSLVTYVREMKSRAQIWGSLQKAPIANAKKT